MTPDAYDQTLFGEPDVHATRSANGDGRPHEDEARSGEDLHKIAARFLEQGWEPIPLAPRTKYPPVTGFTGWRGRSVTAADWDNWLAHGVKLTDHGVVVYDGPLDGCNVAIRMPAGVVGIDIDQYGDKHGVGTIAELEQSLGVLPPTYSSTSRPGTGAAIHYYVVPTGTLLRTKLTDVELIQPHHRFAVVVGSHPEGRPYGIYDRQVAELDLDDIPHVDDLSELPGAWVEYLRADSTGGAADAATPRQADAFIERHIAETNPRALEGIRTSLAKASGSRHDTLQTTACWAMREAAAGFYTAEAAIEVLYRWWQKVMDDPARVNGGEFGSIILWAIGQAEADPERIEKLRTGSTFPQGKDHDPARAGDHDASHEEDLRAPGDEDHHGPAQEHHAGDEEQSADGAVGLDGHRLSDIGNADRLIALSRGRLRFVHAWSKWIAYRQGRWIIDTNDVIVTEYTKRVSRALLGQVKDLSGSERETVYRWARKSETAGAISAMIRLARGIDGVLVDHEELDAHPELLNVRNGTIDLRTAELRSHNPDDLITLQAPVDYDPDATAHLWAACLNRWQPDPAMREYVQREAGAGASGRPTETLSVHYGDGNNGKSKFWGAITYVLGEFAVEPDKSLLVAQRYEPHATVVASMFHKRLGVASETSGKATLNEEMVKRITGGDRLRARRMHEDEWSFWPTHTLVMFSNHKPTVEGRDEGIWRRLRLVPWEVTIPDDDRDEDLANKLTAEAPGILNWIVDGARRFLTAGFKPPAAVTAATRDYRTDQDIAGRFVAEVLRIGTGWVTSRHLKSELERWGDEQGLLPPPRMEDVAEVLKSAGCTSTRRTIDRQKTTVWSGVGVADVSFDTTSDQGGC